MFLVRYVPEVTTLLWVYAVTVVEAETLFLVYDSGRWRWFKAEDCEPVGRNV